MIILLLGLCHCHQLLDHPKASRKFEPYLKNLFLTEKPDLIAEELSEDALLKWKARDSVACRLANYLNVCHLFCDPNKEERNALGIKCRKEIAQELGYGVALTREQSAEVDKIEKANWETREKFWLNKLNEHQPNKCIFLVGADHVDRFAVLLTENDIQSVTVEKDWQP